MSTTTSFLTFADAYLHSVKTVLSDGVRVDPVIDATSVGSAFGAKSRDTLELQNVTFTVSDSDSALILSPPRSLRLEYVIGSVLWTLAASDDVASIAYYNSRGADFSDDGAHLSGAFGKRLQRSCHIDQLAYCQRLLTQDPNSRRAVATILHPTDGQRSTREYPCAIAVQYLVRAGQLCATTIMRAQSVAMVLPYDFALFRALQFALALRLSITPGPLTCFATSFHIYEDEVDLARRILNAPVTNINPGLLKDIVRRHADLHECATSLIAAVQNHDLSMVADMLHQSITSRDVPLHILSRFAACKLKAYALVQNTDSDLPSELLPLVEGYEL